jgi:hypothetical protein
MRLTDLKSYDDVRRECPAEQPWELFGRQRRLSSVPRNAHPS